MKILLINPRYKNTWAAPPIGLGYIASTLENSGYHQVVLIDLTLHPLSNVEFKKLILKVNPDVIGISLMVIALLECRELVSTIQSVTDSPIVLGGPQCSTMPIFTLRYITADFIVIGEGESTFLELVQSLEAREKNYYKIDGLAFIDKNGKSVINNSRRFINNLDNISFPAWHLMKPSDYKYVPALTPVKGTPIAPIITTRGCPYNCSFCGGPIVWRRTFRKRSPNNIVDEIEMLIKDYKVKEIFISDDNFTLLKKHVVEICKEIIKRELDISWSCPNGVRIDCLDNEILKLMKKAGCHLLGFGIESGNQKILDNANKQLDLQVVYKIVKEAKRLNLTTYGFFIIGLPGETSKTIRQTINFAKILQLDYAWFNILMPYPGTKIFNNFIKNKQLNQINWADINSNTGMITQGIKYKDLEKEDLIYWQRRAIREFFLRPKYIMRIIRNTSFGSIKTLFQTSFFKSLFKRTKI